MYLKYQSNKSRKATIVFYALCVLYVLSTATVVSDLLIIALQLEVSKNSSCKSFFLKMTDSCADYWYTPTR